MTQRAGAAQETGGSGWRGWLTVAAVFVVVAVVLALSPGVVNVGALANAQFKTPDLAPLLARPFVVQAHVVSVLIALTLGPVQLALPKGGVRHRAVGWVWAVAMAVVAVSGLFVSSLRFSPLHVLSAIVLIFLPLGIWFARTGRVGSHQRTMIALYIGLVVAGVLAVAPGRLLWEMLVR